MKGRILLGTRPEPGRPTPAGWLAAAATVVWAIVVDQGTKLWASHTPSIAVLHNPDYALGSVSGSSIRLILGTIAVTTLFVIVVIALAGRLGLPAWIPGLVLGGMLSNLLDRMRFGAVRDFLPASGALVNVADAFVLVGVALTAGVVIARLAARGSDLGRAGA